MMTLITETAVDAGSSTSAERRRGLRINQNRPIKVLDSQAGRFFGGQTRDVSATGLRIELPTRTPVRPGKLLCIHVGVSDAGQPLANRRQMIPVRVVWVRRDAEESPSTLTAGVEFVASVAAHLDAA
jgi:hypothetical protein